MNKTATCIVPVILSLIFTTSTVCAEGGQLAFSARQSNNSQSIFLIDEDGENLQELTPYYEGSSNPVWHPNGEYLVFEYYSNLCTITARGTEFQQIAENCYHPSWSPDGQWIAAEKWVSDDQTHIFIMTPSGSLLEDITPGQGTYTRPCWYPATGEILCLSHADGQYFIGAIDIESQTIYDYSYDTDLIAYKISFSPDGTRWVTFTAEGIVIVDAASLDYEVIDGTVTIVALNSITWSPDGKKIAFPKYDTKINQYFIYTLDLESLEQTQVSSTGYTYIDGIAWRPDPTATAVQEEQPSSFSFSAAPNPFNPSTTVSYTLADASEVEINVFSVLGQKIAEIETGYRTAGTYSVQWDASGQASGIYVLRLKAGDKVTTQAITLLK